VLGLRNNIDQRCINMLKLIVLKSISKQLRNQHRVCYTARYSTSFKNIITFLLLSLCQRCCVAEIADSRFGNRSHTEFITFAFEQVGSDSGLANDWRIVYLLPISTWSSLFQLVTWKDGNFCDVILNYILTR